MACSLVVEALERWMDVPSPPRQLHVQGHSLEEALDGCARPRFLQAREAELSELPVVLQQRTGQEDDVGVGPVRFDLDRSQSERGPPSPQVSNVDVRSGCKRTGAPACREREGSKTLVGCCRADVGRTRE